MSLLDGVLTDLAAESDELDRVVANLDADGWRTPTPAEGWTIAHQISHLAWTDHAALLAATDSDGWADFLAGAADLQTAVDDTAATGLTESPEALLTRWRDGRAALATALRTVDGKIPWFGPPMSATSMATARIMETFAHGQDIYDALGLERRPTARLRHVAHLGVRTLAHSFITRGLDPPTAAVGVRLLSPSGETWEYADQQAPNLVSGPALDFCLLVTRRRHRADLALTATGPVADEWLDIAQAFAGPPGSDPARQ